MSFLATELSRGNSANSDNLMGKFQCSDDYKVLTRLKRTHTANGKVFKTYLTDDVIVPEKSLGDVFSFLLCFSFRAEE